jgi:hypothetical protein
MARTCRQTIKNIFETNNRIPNDKSADRRTDCAADLNDTLLHLRDHDDVTDRFVAYLSHLSLSCYW